MSTREQNYIFQIYWQNPLRVRFPTAEANAHTAFMAGTRAASFALVQETRAKVDDEYEPILLKLEKRLKEQLIEIQRLKSKTGTAHKITMPTSIKYTLPVIAKKFISAKQRGAEVLTLVRASISIMQSETESNMFSKHLLRFESYIREYRTLRINLPRQCGKTTALEHLHKEFPALLIGKHLRLVKNPQGSVQADFEGLRGFATFDTRVGQKLQCILIDEALPCTQDTFDNAVATLYANHHLADDFYVLQLGTQ